MIKSPLLALMCAAGLMASTAAQAAPITYTFTGTTFTGGAEGGLSLTGSYTYDPAYYVNFSSPDPWQLVSSVANAQPGLAYGTVKLSDGFTFELGNPAQTATHALSYTSYVAKGDEWFPPGDYDLFSVDAISFGRGVVHTLDLATFGPAPTQIFSDTALSHLSATQPVAFLTPGSYNNGTFQTTDYSGNVITSVGFDITSFETTTQPATPVPEPATFALLAGGLFLLSFRRKPKAGS